MSLIVEVVSFARDYINHPSRRTNDRKAKIREALRLLTGKKVVISCSTCYIEALFTILKISKMATSKYELRKGVVLQTFGHPEMTCTNNTITDALGDYYVKNHPEKLIYFVRYPKAISPAVKVAEVKVVKPKALHIVDPQKIANNIAVEAMNAHDDLALIHKPTEVKAPVKTKRASAKNKVSKTNK